MNEALYSLPDNPRPPYVPFGGLTDRAEFPPREAIKFRKVPADEEDRAHEHLRQKYFAETFPREH